MTQAEYLSLKATLVQGCSPERFDFIESWTIRQRAEFAKGLVLAPSDHLVAATWRMLAVTLAQDVLDLLLEPASCPDRYSPDCECPGCIDDLTAPLKSLADELEQRPAAEVGA